MSDHEHDAEFSLRMPFVTVRTNGGPHHDDSYVAGFEMGSLDRLLSEVKPATWHVAIHAENRAQADLIAMANGYRVEMSSEALDGWIGADFTRIEETVGAAADQRLR
jgi:hypothetical protein